MDESRPGAEVCPQQTVGECLYHTPQDKYGIPKRGWEEGSQASALESPLLPVWLRSPGDPTFGRKTTLKGALQSQGHGQWQHPGVASLTSPPQAVDVKSVSKSHKSKMSSKK